MLLMLHQGTSAWLLFIQAGPIIEGLNTTTIFFKDKLNELGVGWGRPDATPPLPSD